MVEYQNFNASYILWEMVAVNVTALTFSVFYCWFTGHLHLFISICAPIRTEEPEKKKKVQLPTDKNVYRIDCLLFVSILKVYSFLSSALSISILSAFSLRLGLLWAGRTATCGFFCQNNTTHEASNLCFWQYLVWRLKKKKQSCLFGAISKTLKEFIGRFTLCNMNNKCKSDWLLPSWPVFSSSFLNNWHPILVPSQ